VRSSVVPHRNAEGKLVSYDGMLSDITERKRAGQALADAARFPAENPHPVLRIAGDGTLLYANAPSASLLDEWGCALGGSVPEAWRERVAQALVSAKGLRVDIEHKGLMLSFEIVPILRAGYANLYGRDVTEQMRAEKALRESERKYRDVVENLNEGLWAIDQEGRTTYVNRRMAEMLGYTEQEMIGRHLFSFMDEASVESCRQHLARRQQGIREVHTFELLRKDGARVWTQLSTGPVLDPQGAYAGAIAGVIDITDLHRAEQNYRALFENMVDGFALHEIICDSEGRPVDYRFLAVNPTFERLTGLKAADIVGKTVREVLPGIEPSWIETYGRVALTGETAHFERYSGELGKHFEVEAYPFGERRFAAVFVDISDRKHVEAERAITLDLLRLIGSQNDLHGLMREVTRLLREWSECDAVGIRLREGDDFPYFETRGFPAEFVQAESQLCARDAQGYPMRDSAGNPVLECMCGNVLCGRFDPAKPFFTANGSFWSNCTTDLLATTTEGDRQTRTRNRCNAEGYESVALIALRAGNATLGLLQLNDRQKGRFTPERIALLERLATSLGVAIAHRHAQAEVLKREERFRDLAEMLPETIYETDLSGHLTFVNRQAFEMFGYTPADISAGLDCLDMLIPADRPRGAAGMQKVMQGVADRGTEYTAIRKDGSTFPILIFSAAVQREGKPAGLRGIIVDIGQLKEAERHLLAYQGELQSLASELTIAEERERRRLAAFLHDDLGQSLAMAKLKLQETRQAAPGGAWTLLLAQANDLLARVILDTRALTMDLSPPILYELGLEPALEWLAERASGQGGIEAAFEDDGQPKPVSDEARVFLFRAVRELLANVAKHAQARRVRVAVARAGGFLRITVEDDGVGFDARDQGARLQRGAFGLFNVRERIGHLGGAFEIASKLGQGTRVVLTAPLLQ
jgi:PAS domain S-box-containing protein